MALDSTVRTDALLWLSNGTKVFEHSGIVAAPATVAFDNELARLVVVVRAVSAGPFAPAPIDVLLARITAFVVAGLAKPKLRDFGVDLYLRYPSAVDVEVEPQLQETARLVTHRLQELRRRAKKSGTRVAPIIPAQVLAYVLATRMQVKFGRSRATNR